MKSYSYLLLALVTASAGFAQTPAITADAPAATIANTFSGTVTPIPFPTDTTDAEYARRAGVGAIQAWVKEFMTRGVGPKRFAVLPLDRDIDGGYFTEQVRNGFAEAAIGTDYALFTRQDDATYNAILDEIRMGDQFGDTMDPSTIQKFGAMKGVEGIIVGRVAGVYRGVADTGTGVVKIEGGREVIQVRVSMQAYAVETGQLLWGAERMAMAEMPADQLVIKRDWIKQGALWLGGGLFAVFALWVLLGRLKSSNRPR